jgi:hypothetical protein
MMAKPMREVRTASLVPYIPTGLASSPRFFISRRLPRGLAIGLRVSNGLGQHLAELSLCLRPGHQ